MDTLEKVYIKMSNQVLKRNLQNMITSIQNHSLVESVYISPNSQAKSSISSQDIAKVDEELSEMKLENCAGSIQSIFLEKWENLEKDYNTLDFWYGFFLAYL